MADAVFKSADTQDDVTQRLGRALQYEREKQGLSVASIAQQLCLSVAVIRSIEAGNTAELPELVYVRGYVRAYCKVLKIDPEPLLEDYIFNLTQHRDDDFLPAMDEHVHRLTRLWGSLAVFTVVALLVVMWWMDQADELGELPLPASVHPRHALEPTPKRVSPPPEQVAPPSQQVAPPQFPSAADEFLDESLVEITIRASGRSWALVTDGSGESIVQGILSLDYQKTVYGVFPFEFKFGDARSVRLWVDGEEYDVGQHISRLNTAFFTLEQPTQ